MEIARYSPQFSNYIGQKPEHWLNVSENSSEPLDFSTKNSTNRGNQSPSRRSWTPSPESGVSSYGAGSPPIHHSQRESPPPFKHPVNESNNFTPQIPLSKETEPRIYPPFLSNGFSNIGKFEYSVSSEERSQNSTFPPPLPAVLAHIQQTNPVLFSTLCSIASQRVSEIAQPQNISSPSSVPQLQIPSIANSGSFLGNAQLPNNTLPSLPAIANKFPLGLETPDSILCRNDESYLMFRAEMLAKGQIGGKSRRSNSKTCSQTSFQKDSTGSSGEDNTEKDEKRLDQQPPRDDAYWERRRKNNEAAKRSRDARRAKEDEIAIRAAFLETENMQLRLQVNELKRNIRQLYAIQNTG